MVNILQNLIAIIITKPTHFCHYVTTNELEFHLNLVTLTTNKINSHGRK